MAKFAKGARVTGPARTTLADDVAKQYAKGKSIRELAEKNGRSYGFVHRLLVENNVKLRGRGGATRGKTRSSSKA